MRNSPQLQDRVFYLGPQLHHNHFGDPGYYDHFPGSSGKVRGKERGALYVDWGGGNEGWQPSGYVTGDPAEVDVQWAQLGPEAAAAIRDRHS